MQIIRTLHIPTHFSFYLSTQIDKRKDKKQHKRKKKFFRNLNHQIRKKDCAPFQVVAREADSEPLISVHSGLKKVNPYD